MPYRTTLQVHFLAIAERIATFGAPGARRMEVMIVTSLQHFAADVPITVGTLNTERFLEILLAVRHTIFAHVLTIERNSTSVTLEAPNVPLPIQCDQRLTFLQLLMASGALVRINVFAILLLPDRFMVVLKCGCLRRTGGDFFDRLLLLFLFDLSLWGRCRGIRQLLGSRHRSFHTILAEHFFAGVCDLTARLERLFALATGEALLMICVAHGRNYLALDVLIASGALGTVQLLVVQGAIIGAILRKEAASRQRFVAFGALKARLVEISVRNTQHLAGAFFLAFAALDFGFTHFAGYLQSFFAALVGWLRLLSLGSFS